MSVTIVCDFYSDGLLFCIECPAIRCSVRLNYCVSVGANFFVCDLTKVDRVVASRICCNRSACLIDGSIIFRG